MKNAQNEFRKSAENLLSANTTTTIPTSTTTTTATQSQSTIPVPVPPTSSSPLGISTENVENAHNNNNNNATAATEAAHATKMTDEHNNDNNNDTSCSNIVNNNGNLIAEAAKILLKNGLNGTSAAAAALITAATSFQLPTLPLSTATSLATTSIVGNQLDPPPAHVASSSKITKMSSAVAVGHLSQRNNGIPSASSHFKATTKDMCLNATSGTGFLGKSISTSTADTGVIDYTVGTPSNGIQKGLSAATTSGSGSAGGYIHGGSGGGGRLQFFKDGKFILELARSKDGERGGWVSVPRKHFRQPSATTSTVTPASTANACVYPKMESSTSLSFSDDNSSIQSSPWQRDHCWKQTSPKRNISKEMSVYYRLPKDVTMTKTGIQISKRKRRRPYDDTAFNLTGVKLFERYEDNMAGQEKPLSSETKDCQSTHSLQNGNTSITIKNEDEDRCSSSSASTLVGDNECNIAEENRDKLETHTPAEEKAIKTELSVVENTDDVSKTAKVTECESKSTIPMSKNKQSRADDEVDDTKLTVEKMNTSEDGDEIMSMTPNDSQSVVDNSMPNDDKDKLKTVDIDDALTPVQSKTGVEEKRLKRKVERAKLTSIVQKLIDRMPARVSNLAKVPLQNSSTNTQQNVNFLSNKVSPTSSSSTSPSLVSTTSVSATASRLVDYHHQQHVSPRKRILREFEKVSLEDTAATCGAGGKRSRAKSNSNPVMNTNYRNARSPNNRVQSNVCAVPSATVSSTSSTATLSSNGESSQNVSTTSNSSKQSKNSTNTNVPPTRLYSSYSIHSLLSDQGNSSSNCSKSITVKQNSEQSTQINNISYQQHNQHQQNIEHSFNVRKSVSPKSPEAGGGKSPSSNAANKKRSPPYASPMHDSLSRSPSVNNCVDYSPRATPPEFKQRYGTLGLTEQQQNMLSGSSSQHLHQQNHRHLQQGAFYSPYMMSPKYVSSSSSLATGATSPPTTSRSPRHSTTAFTSPTTSTTIASANMQNIPNSYSSHLAPPHQRELSPSRSLADYPRESTPRTVPKKTASIRRQFASPTASSHNTTNNNTSCPSPSERGSEESLSDGKTSNNAPTAAYQQMLQRNSPSAALSSPLHAAAYYMYPPAGPLASASGSSPIAHTAPTSAYIPSYYHSYLSALNITKHYYMGAGASQSAAARLSSPFHPMTIPYNGVSAAAVAAAAAAAAATAAFSGQPHMGHHPMLPPPSAATAAALYGVGGGFGLGLSGVPTSTSTVQQAHKSTESNLAIMNSDITGESPMSTGTTATVSARSAQYSSNKDELSSDVPLNLSKH